MSRETIVPKLVDSPQWQQTLDIWTGETRMCSRCMCVFKEKDNIGQWKCCYHPGKILQGRKLMSLWDCCDGVVHTGSYKHANGCRKADHSPMTVDTYTDIPQSSHQTVLAEIIDNNLIRSPLPETISNRFDSQKVLGLVIVQRKQV